MAENKTSETQTEPFCPRCELMASKLRLLADEIDQLIARTAPSVPKESPGTPNMSYAEDGSSMSVQTESVIHQYDLVTPWDRTTAVYTGTIVSGGKETTARTPKERTLEKGSEYRIVNYAGDKFRARILAFQVSSWGTDEIRFVSEGVGQTWPRRHFEEGIARAEERGDLDD